MSVTAMTWVWKHSTTAGNDRLVLLAIADCADDDGRNAWPAVPTIAAKTRLSLRTVQRVINRLETAGHLIVQLRAGRSGTNLYHLVMDTTDRVIHSPVNLSPRHPDGVTPSVMGPPSPGVMGPPSPGDTRTSLNVHEPPPAREHAPAPPPAEPHGGGGDDPAEALFAALGDAWPLSRGQRRRLHSAVATALAAGWNPAELAAHVGANTAGVRNPYAVLRTRLTDLPDPPQSGPVELRPPWCGRCNQTTRQLELDDGRPIRCPACHPLTATA